MAAFIKISRFSDGVSGATEHAELKIKRLVSFAFLIRLIESSYTSCAVFFSKVFTESMFPFIKTLSPMRFTASDSSTFPIGVGSRHSIPSTPVSTSASSLSFIEPAHVHI